MIERSARTFYATFAIAFILIVLTASPTPVQAQNYSVSYQLLNHPDGTTYYRLNIAIPETLYDYYTQQTHRLSETSDFATYVTPYTLQPIANTLENIYTDDEDFVNAILMIVHQIPYIAGSDVKYPVETLKENEGDCDLFSYIAASIMKAHGLQVILLYYEQPDDQAHMNIAVHLQHEPTDARTSIHSITYANSKYYIAECTGGNWQEGWRIGECPDDLNQPQIIPLGDSEPEVTGQVTASLQNLTTSTITLSISSTLIIQQGTLTMAGQLNPALPDQTVTIYIRINGRPWQVVDTATTDQNGRYHHTLYLENAGIHDIRASWSGNDTYAAADSPTRTVTILSLFFMIFIAMLAVVACISVAVFVLTRRSAQPFSEPLPPEIPT